MAKIKGTWGRHLDVEMEKSDEWVKNNKSWMDKHGFVVVEEAEVKVKFKEEVKDEIEAIQEDIVEGNITDEETLEEKIKDALDNNIEIVSKPTKKSKRKKK